MKKTVKKILKVLQKLIYGILTTVSIIWLVVILSGMVAGVYVVTRVIPLVEQARVDSFDALISIEETTFKHLSDTVVYDNKGEVLAEINVGNYEYVEYKDLSKYIIDGYIAVEDKNFKIHNGVDYKAILRAATALVKNKGEITQGGSTITQQLAKNTLLHNKKTIERKLIEFFLAQDIEKEYNKGKIMEFYVNSIFYGNNCYGIETASKYYFGKSVGDLDVEEAALLIGMSNNATFYNPLTNPEDTKEKRDFVLKVMYNDGLITKGEYEEAKNTEFNFALEREKRVEEDYLTSYAVYNATIELMKIEGFPFKYTFDDRESYDNYKEKYYKVYIETSERIRQGGYKLYTTLDRDKQIVLQEEIDKQLAYTSERQENGKYALQGSAVLINNESGYVEAIVGGRGTEDNFNRGFLAIRQPGSAIKPVIVYGPAYDSLRYYPSYKMEDKFEEDGPNNYNNKYIGSVSLREALSRSINTVAFDLLSKIGPNKGLEYLAEMEFGNITYIDNNNGALALGGFTYGVKPVDLAKAYNTIYNNGVYTDKGCILKIQSEEQGVLYNKDYREKVVYRPEAAYMVLESLVANVEQPYGLSKNRAINRIQTGSKSGTTNSQKDVWFSGMSPYYTLTVWVGYDTPKPTGTYGSGVPGGIWQSIMTRVHEDIEHPKTFEKPPTIIELPIDWKGERVDYSTGREDIFSTEMIEIEEKRKEEERLAKQIQLEGQIREEIEKEIQTIEVYELIDYSGVVYLETREKEMIYQINRIEEDKELRNELIYAVDRLFNKFDETIADLNVIEEERKRKEEEVRAAKQAVLDDIDKDLIFIEENRDNKSVYPIIDSMYSNLRSRIEAIEDGVNRITRIGKLEELYNYIMNKKNEVEEAIEETEQDTQEQEEEQEDESSGE